MEASGDGPIGPSFGCPCCDPPTPTHAVTGTPDRGGPVGAVTSRPPAMFCGCVLYVSPTGMNGSSRMRQCSNPIPMADQGMLAERRHQRLLSRQVGNQGRRNRRATVGSAALTAGCGLLNRLRFSAADCGRGGSIPFPHSCMAQSTPKAQRPAPTKDATPPAKPKHVFRFGHVSVAVFARQRTAADREFVVWNVSIRKSFRTAEGQWRQTQTLSADDLLPAAMALQQAYAAIHSTVQ